MGYPRRASRTAWRVCEACSAAGAGGSCGYVANQLKKLASDAVGISCNAMAGATHEVTGVLPCRVDDPTSWNFPEPYATIINRRGPQCEIFVKIVERQRSTCVLLCSSGYQY